MSLSPFTPDMTRKARIEAFEAQCGDRVRQAAFAVVDRDADAVLSNSGHVLGAKQAAQIVAAFDLGDIEMLMVLLTRAASRLAQPPISGFYVGAVGLEAETGALVLGGNVEFPGTHLGTTLHGEGFLLSRVYSRGTSLKLLALDEAHPCAYCRQFISEFAASAELTLIDRLGHRLSMGDLYPWPFDPAYLGETGADPKIVYWPDLAWTDAGAPDAWEKLLAAGRRSYAPYSHCPAAVLLTLRDGLVVTGAVIESVSFNPSLPPLQAALIDLLAHGYGYDAISSCVLGQVTGGVVDYARSTEELLHAVAPEAGFSVTGWQS